MKNRPKKSSAQSSRLCRVCRLVVLAPIVLILFAPHIAVPVRDLNVIPLGLEDAASHMAEQMDRWHQSVGVYSDAGAAGNHFATLAKIASDFGAVDIDLCSTEAPHSGHTAIKCEFRNTGRNWGGFYFLNGVLSGDDTEPQPNFGDVNDAGLDLRGATRLSFYARGDKGGEKVEVFMGGVGRNAETGAKETPFPDSTARIPALGSFFPLTTVWTRYEIDLAGIDLSYVLGGFAWTCNSDDNPLGATFWIDDVEYKKERPNEPRFIQSFVTLSENSFDVVNQNAALIYDNAIALIALASLGTEESWRRAALIADAFVYVQSHDPTYDDGRLRNAYQAGDLVLPPGWAPGGKRGLARLPIVVECTTNRVFVDRFHVSSYVGNLAWAAIALLTYYEQRGGDQYLEAARRIGEWIEGRRQNDGLGGYRGGVEGFDKPSQDHPADPVELQWCSTEHALEVFVLFTRLHRSTSDARWQECASHAREFVERMWDPARGCFFVGTKDANTIDRNVLTLDVQAWSLAALPDLLSRYRGALACLEARHRTTSDGFSGYDFNDDRDGVWFEGSSHASLAYTIAGQGLKTEEILAELRRAQTSGRNANRRGIVAASHDGMTTGFLGQNLEPQLLYSRLHLGSTAWYVLAERNKNPFFLFPRISRASVRGKKLIVSGESFGAGASILINGVKQKKTSNDEENPTTMLVAKKAGKTINVGDRVKVRNVDGSESADFTYQLEDK